VSLISACSGTGGGMGAIGMSGGVVGGGGGGGGGEQRCGERRKSSNSSVQSFGSFASSYRDYRRKYSNSSCGSPGLLPEEIITIK